MTYFHIICLEKVAKTEIESYYCKLSFFLTLSKGLWSSIKTGSKFNTSDKEKKRHRHKIKKWKQIHSPLILMYWTIKYNYSNDTRGIFRSSVSLTDFRLLEFRKLWSLFQWNCQWLFKCPSERENFKVLDWGERHNGFPRVTHYFYQECTVMRETLEGEVWNWAWHLQDRRVGGGKHQTKLIWASISF